MYLTLRIENFRLKFSNRRNTIAISLALGLVLLLLNFPNKILSGPKHSTATDASGAHTNATRGHFICTESKVDNELLSYVTRAHRFMFVILPLILIVLAIVLLIYELAKSKGEQSSGILLKKDIRNMTKTLIVYLLLLLMLTLPRTVLILVYSSSSFNHKSDAILTAIKIVDLIYSIYLNSSFFILFFKNDLFAEEFKSSFSSRYSIENGNN
jgi:hypothetical protein